MSYSKLALFHPLPSWSLLWRQSLFLEKALLTPPLISYEREG